MVTKEEFKEEVMDLAKEVGLEPKEIHIRKMKKKWASCSSKARLTSIPQFRNCPAESGQRSCCMN